MIPISIPLLLVYLAGFSSSLTASAAQVFEQSGPIPQLIELYTSEGCSSCPPADRTLGALLNDPGLWTQKLPIAFHVDYWDYIGWKDPYAQSQFNERQYSLKKMGSIESIYTPGWVVDGKEWQGFFLGQPLPSNSARQGGQLTVSVDDNQQVSIAYQAPDTTPEKPTRSENLTAHLVILSFNQKTSVTAGENSGKELHHDFVALQELQALSQTQQWYFNLPAFDKAHRKAMVVWLTSAASSQPLQATGGWLE
ncbi:DUF1223 domain-containing protein [Neptunomonas antarctica]|uniref:DUF1223 domain-containing protein n=1 Tax=Neptunomonas antarctica TaxID=619304 RepID=A0A1N7J4Z6_9GAMM|nr:DUF1223 domain-containing protein [Neptunomonas antarctica]SIS44422.1 hypothetical protein SAMN05421760_101622 [Neptunomonas antarctica]